MPDRRALMVLLFVGAVAAPAFGQESVAAIVEASEHGDHADAYFRSGQLARAIAEYTEAIRLDPSRTMYYRARGLLYMLTKDHARALEDFTALIRLEPTQAEGYFLRGTAHPFGPT
jgi:tetratricopeptide (TPR) repeat protein